jgi:hypothetical protein
MPTLSTMLVAAMVAAILILAAPVDLFGARPRDGGE